MDPSFITKELVDYFSPNHSLKICNDLTLDGDWIEGGIVKCPRCLLLNAIKWKYLSPKLLPKVVFEET